MKKSMFRVLTLSLVLSGVGIISSCKDYDEDLRTEVDSKIASVDETIEEKVEEMLKNETVIQNILNQIVNCDCGTNKPWLSDLNSKIEEALATINSKYDAMLVEITNKYDSMQLELNAKLTKEQVVDLLGDYYTKAEIDALLAGLPSSVDFETLKNELGNKLNKSQVEAMLDGYYSKAEIDAIIAGLPTGGTTIDIETLKSEISTYVLQQVQGQITKEFVLGLLGDKFDGYVDQETFNALKAQVDAMTSCGVACTELATLVNELKTRIAEAESKIAAADKKIADAEDKIAANEERIKALDKLYVELHTYCTGLEVKITAAQKTADNALAAAQKAQTAADEAKKVADEALAKATSNATEISKNQDEIKNLKTFQSTWENTLKGWEKDIPTLQTSVEGLTKRVEELEKKMTEVSGVATDALNKAKDAYAQAELNKTEITTIKTTYETLSATVKTLTGRVEGVEGDVEDLKDKVDQNTQDIADLMEAAGLNEEGLKELEKTVQKNREDFDKAVENLNKLTDLVNTVVTDLSNLSGKVDGIAGDVDGLKGDVSSIQSSVSSIMTDVNNLKNWSDDAKKELEQLQKDVDQNAKDIAKNAQDIKELKGYIDAAIQELKKMITSIEVQATKNPLFGSIYLPTGLQTNMLALWYGQALNDGVFPCYDDDAAYIWKGQAMDEPEHNIAGDPKNGAYEYVSGQTLMSDSEDNAGTIYTTINPSNVDFTGVDMNLVNSLDEKSPFKLGAVKPSNEKIQFGITRANNAFYEIPVKISAADVKKVNVGVAESVKDAVKNVMDNISKPQSININKVATAVKDQLAEIRTDALGLKAWVEDDQRGVYSKYAIAGVAIKNPITYSSFKDFNYYTIPGYESAVNLINSVSSRVKNKMKFNIGGKLIDDINALNIKNIEIPELTKDQLDKFKVGVDIDTTIYLEGLKYHFEFEKEVEVPVKFSKDLHIPVNNATAHVTVPVDIQEDITVDLKDAHVTKPTVTVTTGLSSNGENSAVLLVPVYSDIEKDPEDPTKPLQVGTAQVPLDDVNVTADVELGTISIDGTVVGHLSYKKDIEADATINGTVDYTLDIDETVKTTVSIEKYVTFGNYRKETWQDADGVEHVKYVEDPDGDCRSVRLWVRRDFDFSDAINEVFNSVQDPLNNINDMLSQLEKIKNDANDLLDQINSVQDKISDAVDEVADRLLSILDKFNKKIVNLVNSANDKLQPLMLTSDASSTHFTSRTMSHPTWISGTSATFYCTNYLAEVVAPAFKRHVAVTNVISAKTGKQATNAKSLANAVNSSADMNKVLDGKQIRVKASGFQKGYVYELAYSALDYTGAQVTHKYYVRVK